LTIQHDKNCTEQKQPTLLLPTSFTIPKAFNINVYIYAGGVWLGAETYTVHPGDNLPFVLGQLSSLTTEQPNLQFLSKLFGGFRIRDITQLNEGSTVVASDVDRMQISTQPKCSCV
jgi:hypothetical protein